ncbi:MAG TPA: trypsin-like peptidase domain-containing protein [Thermodesulfobacteriota bacterium]|jgi:hypothetical protein|nr:trypsin-like peptidase domain-containing protein [Thermodesulfobacteriota bacterium]
MWSEFKLSRIVALFLTITIFTVGPTNVWGQTPQQIAKKTFPSVVLLVMQDANGQPVSLSSGFFVLDRVIASNYHVVEGASRGYAKVVGQKTKYEIEGITGVDPERDLVLMKVTATPTTPLSLGDSDSVEVGEPVYAIGNPQGLEGTFSQGIVSGIRKIGPDKLLQITAPISPGSSGGPVLNSKGEVIGISVAIFRGGQNLNFAVPSNYLKALIPKAVQTKSLAGIKSSTREHAIWAGFGGPSTDAIIGKEFIWKHSYQNPFFSKAEYSFSLKNNLLEPVRNVICLVIFFGASGEPVEADLVNYKDVIPGGLARRVMSEVDQSVQPITTENNSPRPKRQPEFRILNFEIVQ